MADVADNMVLRTIYLPKELDQQLKTVAIRGERSKGDLIRELIVAGLDSKRKEQGSDVSFPVIVRKAAVTPKAVKRRAIVKKVRTKRARAGA